MSTDTFTFTDSEGDKLTVWHAEDSERGAVVHICDASDGESAAIYVPASEATATAQAILDAAGVKATVLLTPEVVARPAGRDVPAEEVSAPSLPRGYHRDQALHLALSHLHNDDASDAVANAKILATYLEGN